MILDYLTVLDNALALTTSAASANIIDTGAAGDALLAGPGAMVQFLIDTTITSSQSISVTFDLQTATNSAFSNPVTLVSSGAISRATLVTGNVPYQAVIHPGCLRYLRAYYTSNGTIQAGNVDCRIVTGGDTDVTIDKQL
jgi:hypothetical protein